MKPRRTDHITGYEIIIYLSVKAAKTQLSVMCNTFISVMRVKMETAGNLVTKVTVKTNVTY